MTISTMWQGGCSGAWQKGTHMLSRAGPDRSEPDSHGDHMSTPPRLGCVLHLWTILLLVRHQLQRSKVVSQPDHEYRGTIRSFQGCKPCMQFASDERSFPLHSLPTAMAVALSVHRLC